MNNQTGNLLGAAVGIVACIVVSAVPVQAADPILQWRFDGTAQPGSWQGEFGQPTGGPQTPRYPGFPEDSMAATFAGHKGWILLKDHQRGGFVNVRFGAGETFAFETWVRVKSLSSGEMVYLIGKGRHGEHSAKSGHNNQNYAVRLKGDPSGGKLGFLFSSQHPETKKREWHRWWSNEAMSVSGWHHVAIDYTFGQRDSLHAYIDGKPVSGVWDMGGATDLPPVQDEDDLVIGTGYQRTSGSSLQGFLDNIAIYREPFKAEEMATRYAYVPPPPPVTPDMIPRGKVLVQISEEGVGAISGWPDEPKVTETYEERALGLFEVPQKYVSTGVRADRANPFHLRASTIVHLPRGKHRLLLRGRGGARLTINGTKVLETKKRPGDTGGHGLLAAQDEFLNLGPDFRFVPPGNREAWTEFESAGGEHFVILETMVGGVVGSNRQRPELGETVVAISLEGESSWSLLVPDAKPIPYTDSGWASYESERRRWLEQFNAESRAKQRAKHGDYWQRRREVAQQWLAGTEPVAVPKLPGGFDAHNDIDHFIAARIVSVAEESQQVRTGGVDYFRDVRPILESRCYDCHQGDGAQGNLQIDDRRSTLAGGESDGPAIVPGRSHASALIDRVTNDDESVAMPPNGERLSDEEIATLKRWIDGGAAWPQFDVADFETTPLSDDLDFLRRVTLDTVGVTPTEAEIAEFQNDSSDQRRSAAIDRLLDDPRWADHWMGYWLDVLAENPNIINPTLNNTGPFRWWLYESLLDNKPADLFVTELLRMEGSERFGGPAGFATASQNDLPMAAKGIIVSSAFLGVQMKCARCHDAPAHVSMQEDLLQLAALLKQDSIKLPESSSVPTGRLEHTGRAPLIQVTLKPGAVVQPEWPFARYCDEAVADQIAEDPDNSRDRLAALITAPQNERFAQVMVNRIWQRLMGRGLVETIADWEKGRPSHPDLLRWLAREFVASGYDVKAISRLILNSHAYQRATNSSLNEPSPLYISPAPRRLTAEQIVDSVFHATGAPFDLEEVSLDIDSVRVTKNSISLGKPRRAWMLASTSNERDRPSLSLPRITAVTSLMETFGWRGARQDPLSLRDHDTNVLQPAIYANGVMATWLTRLSDRHELTRLVQEDQPVERLVERLFLRLLTRPPTPQEAERYVSVLSEGYDSRVIPESERKPANTGERTRQRYVSWSNHLDGAANVLAAENQAKARRGDPPTNALTADWRLRMEDAVWAILNAPEWMFTP